MTLYLGEIREKYSSPAVTVVSSNDHLVSEQYPGKFQNNVNKILDEANVKVNTFIENTEFSERLRKILTSKY